MDTLAISVRRATPSDAPALAALINDTYRVESFFVEGDRTNAIEIAQMIAGTTGMFLVLEDAVGLAAAVWIEPKVSQIYFGMLSVRADLQKLGLGTRLVRITEAMGEAMGAREVTLKIVNLREELARWYKSLGFVECGTAPYVHRPVTQPCHFVDMRKPLGAERDAGRNSSRAA